MSGRLYYPRAIVSVIAMFDDQVGGVTQAAWTSIPKRIEISRNTARKADRCRMELDYRDFPFDPRLLKAVHVTAHIEAALDPLAPIVPIPTNLRFQGTVDAPEASLGPDEESVTFTARDYTSFYLGRSWRQVADSLTGGEGQQIRIPIGLTLQAFVEQIRLKVTPETGPAVFRDPSVATQILASKLGKTSLPVEEADTAWDVLGSACEPFGQVPVWEIDPILGAVLTIRSASEAGLGSALMQYGRNVSSLTFRRNLQKPEDKAVHVVAWNPILGIAIEGDWPPLAGGEDLGANGTPTTTRPKPKRVQYSVEGNYTPDQVLSLAKILHQELSQDRLTGEMNTREMSDLLDGSLLALANGDRLLCPIGTEVQASIEGMSPNEAVAHLSDPNRASALPLPVAQALVLAWGAAQQLGAEFYILEADHHWDRSDGYRLTIRFRDFILTGA